MGKAYTCDRCGRLFKQSDYNDTVPVILECGIPFNIDLGNASVYVSLCPSCRASFQRWWDEGATYKTTDGKHKINIYEVPEDDENE